jgi:hypothetical protein
MGERARFQRTTCQHANRLALLSGKPSDKGVFSSLASAVNTVGNRRGRLHRRGEVEWRVVPFFRDGEEGHRRARVPHVPRAK